MTKPLHIQLRERREQLGLTQAQAAERLEISQPAVARLETGNHPPTKRMRDRIKSAYDVRIIETLIPNTKPGAE